MLLQTRERIVNDRVLSYHVSLMKKTFLFLVPAFLLLLSSAAADELTPQAKSDRRVIMVVANGISTTDLLTKDDAPRIHRSVRAEAAVGLMNSRAARRAANASGSYLSIGAGARANAGKFGRMAFNKGEAIQLQGVPQNLPLRGPGQVVSPSYPEMARLAAKLTYQATPGMLGELLRLGGVKRSVYGNSDTLGAYRREVNLIAMDTEGSTDFGNVAKPIDTADQALRTVDQGLRKSDFVVLEYAPTSRIDFRRDFLSDKAIASQRSARLREVDRIFGDLLDKYADRKTMIMLVSPLPPSELAKSGALQTPLVVAGPGYRGLLTSAGTRWPGQVTNSDIAPTVLTFFGLPVPTWLPGRALGSTPAAAPLATIDGIAQKALINNAARSVLLSGYITVIVAAVIAVVCALLLRPSAKRVAYLQPLLLALLFMPTAMLIGNVFDYPAPWLPLLLIPATSILIAFATWFILRGRPLSALFAPAFLSAVVVLIQLPFGSILERNSVMGMSSIIGARFYGIGNEYTGVLLGSAVVGLSAWLTLKDRGTVFNSAAAATVFLGITFILGFPALGANVGGALASVATGVVATLLMRGVRLAPKHVFYIVGGMAAAIGIILATDYFSSSVSHAGRAAALVGGGGPGQALMIITRKLSTNFMLVTHSSWTKIIVSAAAATAVLRLGARPIYNQVAVDYKIMGIGFKSIALGATTAFLLNDSGVVAAALMITYAICAWLYLMIASASKPA